MWCYTFQIEEVPANCTCIMSPDWGGPCWGSCNGAGKTCGLVSRLGVGGVSQPWLYQVRRHLWHPRGPHCHERNPAVQGGWVQHYATVTQVHCDCHYIVQRRHHFSSLVPRPLLSQGKMVWWTKSNFFLLACTFKTFCSLPAWVERQNFTAERHITISELTIL